MKSWRTLVWVASKSLGMETTVYPRVGSDKDSAVTAPALAAPLAPAGPADVAAGDAEEPPLAPAVLSGGTVPPPLGLPDEHPTSANEAASTPAPRAPATRPRPGKRMRERATRKHLHNQAEHSHPAQQQPLDPTGRSQQCHGPDQSRSSGGRQSWWVGVSGLV